MFNKAFKMMTFLIVPLAAVIASYFISLWSNDAAQFAQNPFGAEDIARMSAGKVIVVTGASAGLGKSSAKLLVQAGKARAVILACRSMKKCHETKTYIMDGHKSGRVNVIPLELDLASLSSIRNFASNLQTSLKQLETQNGEEDERTIKIDVLMNNAGIMGVDYTISNDTNVELQMHVNHLGHFALTSLLKDNLINGGRVVSVSSLAGAFPVLKFNDINFIHSPRAQIRKYLNSIHVVMAYSASKRANLVFTQAMNDKFSSVGITAVAAHPGYSRSSLMHSGWDFAPMWLRDFLATNTIGSMSCDYGALSQIRAALDVENVKANQYVGPLYYLEGRPVIVGTATWSFHHLFWPIGNEMGEKLWKFSENAIGWKFRNDTLIQ